MFTGLIETTGTILKIDRKGTSVVIAVRPECDSFDVRNGDSVAINGACLTIEKHNDSVLSFSAVRETLNRTTLGSSTIGTKVNMERALKVGDRLDGHMVLGHVDGIGVISDDQDMNGSILRTIKVPSELRPFMAEKGSVTVDGISLTIAKSTIDSITISFIPVTLEKTTMLSKKAGDPVNLECDLIARYLHRLLAFKENAYPPETTGDLLLSKMERLGF